MSVFDDDIVQAEALCVPCKLCGCNAVISDAGTGRGYFIKCSNSRAFRKSAGCMIGDNRLGGCAYNVAKWWNRLHATKTTETEK